MARSQRHRKLQRVLQIAGDPAIYRIFWHCRRANNFTEGLRQKILPQNSAEASAEETFVWTLLRSQFLRGVPSSLDCVRSSVLLCRHKYLWLIGKSYLKTKLMISVIKPRQRRGYRGPGYEKSFTVGAYRLGDGWTNLGETFRDWSGQ